MDDGGLDPDQDNGQENGDESERGLRAQLATLKDEHRDLDAAIAALSAGPGPPTRSRSSGSRRRS